MPEVQILMPMAGAGKRFSDKGFNTPKPLIMHSGQPLFYWSLMGLESLKLQKKITAVILRERESEFQRAFKESGHDIEIKTLENSTGGPLETVLEAECLLDTEKPLIILDSDLYFKSTSFIEFLNRADFKEVGGAVLTFKSEKPHFSFARLDERGLVLETAEKKRISDDALAGCYFFSSAGAFLGAAKLALKEQTEASETRLEIKAEPTVAPVYNRLKNFGKIIGFELENFQSLGTPEELESAEVPQ